MCLAGRMTQLKAALLLALASTLSLAGEQLSTRELVGRSEAIAVVEVTLAAGKAKDQVVVKSWLKGAAGDAPLDPSSWFGVCLPTRKELTAWTQRYPQHAGRATWARALAQGRGEQVVFLARRQGAWQPTCETEVLLGRAFSAHPEHQAFRDELAALLSPFVKVPAAQGAGKEAPGGPVPTRGHVQCITAPCP